MTKIKVRRAPSRSYKVRLSYSSQDVSSTQSALFESKDKDASIDDMIAVMAVNADLCRYDELDGHRMMAVLEHKS